MREYLGKRILIQVGDNDTPRMSCVHLISPNGLYVRFYGDGPLDEAIGWLPVSAVKVLDVIQPADEPLVKAVMRSYGP